jgi:hypothetical protein
VQVDGVLARVGGHRRQGEAGHRRRSVSATSRRFDSVRYGRLARGGGLLARICGCDLVSERLCVKDGRGRAGEPLHPDAEDAG